MRKGYWKHPRKLALISKQIPPTNSMRKCIEVRRENFENISKPFFLAQSLIFGKSHIPNLFGKYFAESVFCGRPKREIVYFLTNENPAKVASKQAVRFQHYHTGRQLFLNPHQVRVKPKKLLKP